MGGLVSVSGRVKALEGHARAQQPGAPTHVSPAAAMLGARCFGALGYGS